MDKAWAKKRIEELVEMTSMYATKYYDEDKARQRFEKRFRDLNRLYKNFTCYTLNDFTSLSKINKIQLCSNVR